MNSTELYHMFNYVVEYGYQIKLYHIGIQKPPGVLPVTEYTRSLRPKGFHEMKYRKGPGKL